MDIIAVRIWKPINSNQELKYVVSRKMLSEALSFKDIQNSFEPLPIDGITDFIIIGGKYNGDWMNGQVPFGGSEK